MNTTQNQVPISDIKNDIVFLKDGGASLILQVSAVNFWLLSEQEQMAIIYAFAQMLNSLSFPIQIVILSERLDISSYLEILDQALSTQKNPLLSKLMVSYKEFIQKMIKENDVLDKKFFLIIPFYNLELGFKSHEGLKQKIKTTLLPRKDQIVRSLARVGLDAIQMQTQQIAALFYKIYNGGEWTETLSQNQGKNVVNLNNPLPDKPVAQTPAQTVEKAETLMPAQTPVSTPIQPGNHPFVVEELEENT